MGLRQTLILLMFMLFPTIGLSQIQIAVASNFKPTMELLVTDYLKFRLDNGLKPVSIHISAASTGTLFAQISHGAPFDILFSADSSSVDRLKQQLNLPDENAFVYAIGSLVFYCRQTAPDTMKKLMDWSGVYGQANKRLAPYGQAASEVVDSLNWTGNKVITAANVAQVSHFVATGSLDCGFTAKSLIPKTLDTQRYFNIPSELHRPIIQKALVLSQDNNPDIDEFRQYIVYQGRKIIIESGYLVAH